MKHFFVTATDTDAGKTYVSQVLVYQLAQRYKVAAYKPISAGCDEINGQLINQDADLLATLANCGQSIHDVNPIAYKEPIAPHIAAATLNQAISIDSIQQGFIANNRFAADITVTEGAGGWRLPLGNGRFLSEFAQINQCEVILVVNMKLGCLNHACLTYGAIKQDGLNCIGWVANCINDMPYLEQNIAELTQLIDAPLVARFGFEPDIKKAAKNLKLSALKL